MKNGEMIQIDVEQVLKSKLGRKSVFIPKSLVKWLKGVIRQDELNDILRKLHPRRNADFCEGVLAELQVKIDIVNPSQLPPLDNSRVIFVCNHPLGGLDGIALIAALTRKYGQGVRFVVNDLLMAVEPISEVFLPINKHGKQSRESIQNINAALAGPHPVLIFPAGLVSRKNNQGEIKDLEWHKMFVAKAIQSQRDVVPLYFSGQNSDTFYSIARRRKNLGIKFNYEMIYLPSELIKARGSEFKVIVGSRISWLSLKEQKDQELVAQAVKKMTYELNDKLKNHESKDN